MSKTETIQTAKGDVEVEVAECSSCGDEYMKEDLKQYYTGEVKREEKYSDWIAVRFKKGSISKGYICKYCNDSPIGTPKYSLKRSLGIFLASGPFEVLLIILFIITIIAIILT
jgi:hypothetical protein